MPSKNLSATSQLKSEPLYIKLIRQAEEKGISLRIQPNEDDCYRVSVGRKCYGTWTENGLPAIVDQILDPESFPSAWRKRLQG